MHIYDHGTDELAQKIFAYALNRVRLDPPPLDGPRTFAELTAAAGQTITAAGIGGDEALRLFSEHLAPATISIDHPMYLAFIPGAPTEASVLFDLVVGASSIYGGSWMEGAGAVYAENQALAWLASLAGLPSTAGGSFVQGGSIGNLSALVTARDQAMRRRSERPRRWAVLAAESAHSSVNAAARVMDVDVLATPVDREGRLSGAALRSMFDGLDDTVRDGVFAVSATSGTTNLGIVDRLDEVASFCRESELWMHVDGAYGGAALAAPSARHLFDGIEHADSFIVDPHKWLYAPFDACALLYREPEHARHAHTQHAGYLDVINERPDWNPSDYSFGLSRRARGLPFWFSLATHGTDAYRDAIETALRVAREIADVIDADSRLELVRKPDLSVVAFRRVGWHQTDYNEWSARLLRDQVAFVTPSTHGDQPILRFAIVNPRTSVDALRELLRTL